MLPVPADRYGEAGTWWYGGGGSVSLGWHRARVMAVLNAAANWSTPLEAMMRARQPRRANTKVRLVEVGPRDGLGKKRFVEENNGQGPAVDRKHLTGLHRGGR